MTRYRLVWALLLCAGCSALAQAAPRPANHAELAALRQGFGAMLVNPSSIVLRRVVAVNANGMTQTCGELRSKDAKGRVSPYVRFFATLYEDRNGAYYTFGRIDEGASDEGASRSARFFCSQNGLL